MLTDKHLENFATLFCFPNQRSVCLCYIGLDYLQVAKYNTYMWRAG